MVYCSYMTRSQNEVKAIYPTSRCRELATKSFSTFPLRRSEKARQSLGGSRISQEHLSFWAGKEEGWRRLFRRSAAARQCRPAPPWQLKKTAEGGKYVMVTSWSVFRGPGNGGGEVHSFGEEMSKRHISGARGQEKPITRPPGARDPHDRGSSETGVFVYLVPAHVGRQEDRGG